MASNFAKFLYDFAGESSEDESQDLYTNIQSSQITFPDIDETQIFDQDSEQVT